MSFRPNRFALKKTEWFPLQHVDVPATLRIMSTTVDGQIYSYKGPSRPTGANTGTDDCSFGNGPGVLALGPNDPGDYWWIYYDGTADVDVLLQPNDGATGPDKDEGGFSHMPSHSSVSLPDTNPVTVMAANRKRKFFYLSNNTGIGIRLGFGFVPSATDGLLVPTGTTFMMSGDALFRGVIRAIVQSGGGGVAVAAAEGA